MIPSLQAILAYQNEDIVSRFVDKYEVTEAEAADIFTETKKFLYLSHFERVFITNDLLIIDEMWHNFILFTHEYQQFCQTHFGGFKHHMPTPKVEKEARERRRLADQEGATQEFMNQLEWLMSVTYDHLGAETVEKWFDEYAEKYGPKQLKALTV